MTGIFDTHAHYDDERFDGTRGDILAGLPGKGVCLVLNCASDLDSARRCLDLAAEYPFCVAAAGIHPHEASTALPDYADRLRDLLKEPKAVAVGEIGLDYHYDFSPRETQLRLFEAQLVIANELSLPVVIHDREAHGDTFDLVKKHRPRGVIHCYSGSAEQAVQLAGLGMYLGFGGAVTFVNAKKALAAVAAVPLEYLLLETDCPYMAPVPFRGQNCTSDMIEYAARTIAAIRGIDEQELINVAAENGKRLFNIKE